MQNNTDKNLGTKNIAQVIDELVFSWKFCLIAVPLIFFCSLFFVPNSYQGLTRIRNKLTQVQLINICLIFQFLLMIF